MIRERLIDWANVILYGRPHNPAFLSTTNWYRCLVAGSSLSIDQIRAFCTKDGAMFLSGVAPDFCPKFYVGFLKKYKSHLLQLVLQQTPSVTSIGSPLLQATSGPTHELRRQQKVVVRERSPQWAGRAVDAEPDIVPEAATPSQEVIQLAREKAIRSPIDPRLQK